MGELWWFVFAVGATGSLFAGGGYILGWRDGRRYGIKIGIDIGIDHERQAHYIGGCPAGRATMNGWTVMPLLLCLLWPGQTIGQVPGVIESRSGPGTEGKRACQCSPCQCDKLPDGCLCHLSFEERGIRKSPAIEAQANHRCPT